MIRSFKKMGLSVFESFVVSLMPWHDTKIYVTFSRFWSRSNLRPAHKRGGNTFLAKVSMPDWETNFLSKVSMPDWESNFFGKSVHARLRNRFFWQKCSCHIEKPIFWQKCSCQFEKPIFWECCLWHYWGIYTVWHISEVPYSLAHKNWISPIFSRTTNSCHMAQIH
jgi:hypothetical protein